MKRSRLIVDRFKECSENGEISMSDELHLLNYLINRYQFTSVADYARHEGITITGANKRLEAGKVQYVNLAGRNLIFLSKKQ